MASEQQSVFGDPSLQQKLSFNNLGVLHRAILIQPTLERDRRRPLWGSL